MEIELKLLLIILPGRDMDECTVKVILYLTCVLKD